MNTYAAGTRLSALTEASRAFLRDCPVADPAMVSLEPTLSRISIQAGHHQDALDHVGELLLWAYTLTQVRGPVVAHPRREPPHLHRRPRQHRCGAQRVRRHPLRPLRRSRAAHPGDSEGVSLDEIYTLLGLLREHHHTTTIPEVAA